MARRGRLGSTSPVPHDSLTQAKRNSGCHKSISPLRGIMPLTHTLQMAPAGGPVFSLAWDSKHRYLAVGGNAVVQLFKVSPSLAAAWHRVSGCKGHGRDSAVALADMGENEAQAQGKEQSYGAGASLGGSSALNEGSSTATACFRCC